MQSLDMYRGRLRTMMVTGDHYMTASAVAHSLGIFEKGGKRVVLDMISTKPAASEAPATAPPRVSTVTAAVASRFGGTQHRHQDLSHAALRHNVTQHSRLTAANSPSSRVTFLLNPCEDRKLAAVRASLEESLRTPSASPAAAPAQQAPAVSASPAAALSQQAPAVPASLAAAPSQQAAARAAAANACQLSARSFSCAPAVHAAAASPAAAIAASSALFRSSSLQAAAPAAATSAATSAASSAPAKAPSRLLDSYLQSMGMAKSAQAGSAQAGSAPQAGSAQAGSAQAGSAQAQPASAQTQQVSAQPSPLHAQSRFANRYKSVCLHAIQALRHALDTAFIYVFTTKEVA